jgi:putative SOS response-associated peptidase YedK
MNICGRYLVDDEVYAGIWEMLNTPAQNLARGEVFPTNIAPVITRDDGVMAVKWGFPHWKSAGVIINARAETAHEKNMFRKPLSERRCVVLSCGFFEWSRGSGESLKTSLKQFGGSCGAIDESLKNKFSSHDAVPACAPQSTPVGSNRKKMKDKYLFRRPGAHMLYMAGMMSIFRDAFGNEYSAFVILTTSANGSMSPIHDRMPVILAPDELNLWISDDIFREHALHRVGPELEPSLIV